MTKETRLTLAKHYLKLAKEKPAKFKHFLEHPYVKEFREQIEVDVKIEQKTTKDLSQRALEAEKEAYKAQKKVERLEKEKEKLLKAGPEEQTGLETANDGTEAGNGE